jgi:tagaturonate reductase
MKNGSVRLFPIFAISTRARTSIFKSINMLKTLNRIHAGISEVRPVKVLQFGEGVFLRAFVDWVIDILNEKTDFNGAVQVIQPRGYEKADALNAQEGLYHVIINGLLDGQLVEETRLITCIADSIAPSKSYEKFLRAAENPFLEFIFSNTTEAGIAFDPKDVSIDSLPNSFPGKLTSFLHHRFNFFKGDLKKAPTIIPCELIENNGSALKSIMLQYIHQWRLPSEFKSWVENHITFCNTLVDRIVPGFPKEKIHEIQNRLGFEDNLVVTAEPFLLWVIEGPEKVRQALRLDKVDLAVKFVSDLTPYRTRKVRILNGAHTAMVPVAYLMGLRTVKEAVDDTVAGSFIRSVIYDEIIPTLDLPADELKQFADDVLERFQNPYIKHELSSIALNSISKFKTRVLPTLLEFEAKYNRLPKNIVYSLAALIHFYKGELNSEKLPVQDAPEIVGFFKTVWQQESLHAIATQVLANEAFWGRDLNTVAGLTSELTASLSTVNANLKVAHPPLI